MNSIWNCKYLTLMLLTETIQLNEEGSFVVGGKFYIFRDKLHGEAARNGIHCSKLWLS